MIIPNPHFYPRIYAAELQPGPQPALTVVEPASGPIDTGLLDQNGHPLKRTETRPRIGFLPWGDPDRGDTPA